MRWREGARVEYMKRYREANRWRVREYNSRYRLKHRDRLLAKSRELQKEKYKSRKEYFARRYVEKREHIRATNRRYAQANPEKMRERAVRWRKEKPELYKAGYRKRNLKYLGYGINPILLAAKLAQLKLKDLTRRKREIVR